MNELKIRHGCLTVWLVWLLIANSAIVMIYIFSYLAIKEIYPNAPVWAFPILTLGVILNIVFLIALFRWKKWGLWGSVVTYSLLFIVNLLVGISFIQAFLGLSGLVILFGVLQIGKEHKGWSQLE